MVKSGSSNKYNVGAIIIGVVLIFILCIGIGGGIAMLTDKDDKLNTNQDFMLDGIYKPVISDKFEELVTTPALVVLYMDGLRFNKDGTCEALRENNKENVKCYYEYENNIYKLEDDGFNFNFELINNETLKDQFGYTWKLVNGIINNDTGQITNNASKVINYDKFYPIAQVNNSGKKLTASIAFFRNGTCKPFFGDFNNCSSSSEFCIFYQRNDSPCKYKMNDNIISIDWNDIYEVVYSYHLGTGAPTNSVIGSNYIMKDIQFQYYPDGDYIDTINGEWKVTPGAYFTVDFILNNN